MIEGRPWVDRRRPSPINAVPWALTQQWRNVSWGPGGGTQWLHDVAQQSRYALCVVLRPGIDHTLPTVRKQALWDSLRSQTFCAPNPSQKQHVLDARSNLLRT